MYSWSAPQENCPHGPDGERVPGIGSAPEVHGPLCPSPYRPYANSLPFSGVADEVQNIHLHLNFRYTMNHFLTYVPYRTEHT